MIETQSKAGPAKNTAGKFHEPHEGVRALLSASVSRVTDDSFLRIPNFYPGIWPLLATFGYFVLLLLGTLSAGFLALLAAESGNAWLALGLSTGLLTVEFFVVPVLKLGSLQKKSCASMRAFLAEDPKARAAFQQEAKRWGFRDWLVAILLTATFVLKAHILINFGTFWPTALLLGNWAIAIGEFAGHLSTLTSRVPYFILARVIDRIHRRRRLRSAAKQATATGQNAAGMLEARTFEFDSPVVLSDDEVMGNELRRIDGTMRWRMSIVGLLDDTERATFLQRQPDAHRKAVLGLALAKVQLELLNAPEPRAADQSVAVYRLPEPDRQPGRAFAAALLIGLTASALAVTGCGHPNPSAGKNLRIAMVQPASADLVNEVVTALRDQLLRAAAASKGANVPLPDIRIIRAEDAALPSPVIGKPLTGFSIFLFGDQTPAAKTQRLENTLNALQQALKTRADGKVVPPEVIKQKAQLIFKGARFLVWNAGSGTGPWKTGESPASIEDRAGIIDELMRTEGNLLVLTDTNTTPASAAANPAGTDPNNETKAAGATTHSNSVPPNQPAVIVAVDSAQPPPSSPSPAPIIPVGIELPPGAIAFGLPTLFDSNTAILQRHGLDALNSIIGKLKDDPRVRNCWIYLVASADCRSTENTNVKLSRERGATVEAALLRAGFAVHRVICIGNRLSPRTTSESELMEQRSVQLYLVPKRTEDGFTAANARKE